MAYDIVVRANALKTDVQATASSLVSVKAQVDQVIAEIDALGIKYDGTVTGITRDDITADMVAAMRALQTALTNNLARILKAKANV